MELSFRERFAALLALPDAAIALDEAALLIAAHAQPGLDIATELTSIDALASQVTDPTLTGVCRLLFRDLHFDGNRSDYYDPRNSFLDQVISRRVGIPITLSVLTMEVARRVGVPLSGVGMPGHFLVRDKVDHSVFVDPFNHGRALDARGCETVFRQMHGPTTPFLTEYLEPVTRASILARMLNNLRGIYTERHDYKSLAWVLELTSEVPGADAEAIQLAALRLRAQLN